MTFQVSTFVNRRTEVNNNSDNFIAYKFNIFEDMNVDTQKAFVCATRCFSNTVAMKSNRIIK